MPDISKITLPSGTTYDIKDAVARQSAAGGIQLRGVTTTELVDEATTNPITINGESYTAVNQDAVFYGKKEFVFDGTNWHEFGDMSGLGDLAHKNTASGSYTPAGNVSQPTFTGTPTTFTGTYKPTGTITVTTKTTDNKTATVSKAPSGTATYTPEGTVSAPTFTGSSSTVAITSETDATTGNYTPAGSVAAPTISVKTAGSTTSVHSITAVGTLPELTTTVENETLTIGFSKGTLPTKGSAQTVKTGDAEYQATAPAFTGTKVKLSGTTTAAGSVAAPTFTGTGARLVTDNIQVPSEYTATFTGNNDNVSVSGTPNGEVSQPTFSGTADTIIVS